MTNSESNPSLADLIEQQLDPRLVAGLRELIADDPKLLERTLDELGYLPHTSETAAQTQPTADLPDAQQRVLTVVEEMGSPQSAGEIVDLIDEEYPALKDEFKSAQHRPWVSTQLNELVEKGLVGRFRDGRTVRYISSPSEAIRHWALHNSRFVEDLEQSDVMDIANDTGMPVRTTREALSEMIEE